MFPMQNFEPESAVISAASNSALIEKYLRNTCLGQGAVPRCLWGRLHMCEVNCMCVRLIVGRPEIFEKKKKDKQYYKRRKTIIKKHIK